METKYKPVIGTKYGLWTVISEQVKQGSVKLGTTQRTAYWKVRCECGRESWRSAYNLTHGITNSCKSCCKCPNDVNTFINNYYKRVVRRANREGFECNVTPKYLEELYLSQGKKCALSGLDLEFAPQYRKLNDQNVSLDRIDPTKGYIVDNVQWVHKHINMMKWKLSQEEFIKLCSLVAGYSKCL